MADETPETPEQETPETPEAVSINKLRLHSSKIYPQAAVDQLVQKVAAESEQRDSVIEEKITNAKTELATSLNTAVTNINSRIAAVKEELEQEIAEGGGGGTGTSYKGTIDHETDLADIAAHQNPQHGDWYIAKDTEQAWIWTVKDGVGDWVKMSGSVDLSNYYTKDEVYSKQFVDGLVTRLAAAEGKLTKITTALSELLNTDALVYETYTADEMFTRMNTFLRVLKAAVAPATEPEEP